MRMAQEPELRPFHSQYRRVPSACLISVAWLDPPPQMAASDVLTDQLLQCFDSEWTSLLVSQVSWKLKME